MEPLNGKTVQFMGYSKPIRKNTSKTLGTVVALILGVNVVLTLAAIIALMVGQ